jgi:hypothetical protein
MRYSIVTPVSLMLLTLPVRAAEADAVGGCEKFAWPLARERAWFARLRRQQAAMQGPCAVRGALKRTQIFLGPINVTAPRSTCRS